MTIKVTKPKLNVREEITKTSNLGKMAYQDSVYYEKIPYIKEGLLIDIDAANHSSFPYRLTTSNLNSLSTDMHFDTMNNISYSSEGGGSVVFDGTGYGNATDTGMNRKKLACNSVTCEAWVKSRGNPVNGFHVICQMNGGYSGNSVWGLRAGYGTTLHALASVCYSSNSGDQTQVGNIAIDPEDGWLHLVSVVDTENKLLKAYVNSKLIDSYALGSTINPLANDAFTIGLGDGRYANVYLSQLRVYSRALSSTEIQANYDLTKTRFGL